MEGTQEPSSSKPLTKSSRKRLRKKQAAALEKHILTSEASGSCKIESTQTSNPESIEIRGCLSSIVFNNNSLGEKEFFVSDTSPHDAVNTKAKSICCEDSENILLEKSLNTKKESVVSHTKRKRNEKKPLIPEESNNSSGGSIVSKSQKSVETQVTQHHGAPQKDCLKQETPAVLSGNISANQAPVVNKDINKVDACDKLDDAPDIKQQEETVDRAATLSRSRRRRNRKKVIASLEHSETLEQSLEDKGTKRKETPEYPPQLSTEKLAPQKDCISGQIFNLDSSIYVSSEIPASDTKSDPVKNILVPKCEETVWNITKDVAKREGKLQVSTFPEHLGDDDRKTCDSSCKSPSKERKGISVKEVVRKGPLNIVKEDITTVVPQVGVGKSKHLQRVATSEGCESVYQKEHATGNIGKDTAKKEGKLQVSTLSEHLGDTNRKTYDPSCKSPSDKRKGVSLKEVYVQKGPLDIEKEKTTSVVPEVGVVKSKHSEKVVKSEDCGSVCQKEQSQSSLVFQKSGDSPPTICCLSTENLPTNMAETHENVSQAGKIQDKSSSNDKRGIQPMFISKFVSVPKMTAPVSYDEVDRASAAISRLELHSLPDSSGKRESISKNGENLKVIPEMMIAVSKDAPIIRKVAPVSSELVNKSLVTTDSVRIEGEPELHKKDGDSSNTSLEAADKSKEKIKAEREARKAAKMAKKQKDKTPVIIKEAAETHTIPSPTSIGLDSEDKKVVESVEEKPKVLPPEVSQEGDKINTGKSKAELRAERRAKQEAQRAAKAEAMVAKVPPIQGKVKSAEPGAPKTVPPEGGKAKVKQPRLGQKGVRKKEVMLLSRLGWGDGRVKRSNSEDTTLKETQTVHPAIVQLSTKFTDRIVSGSNARCLAFVQAIKKAILDYQTPPQKELGRDLEARLLTPSLAYLESQRPHAVSVLNATKFLKWQLTQLQPIQQCSIENSSVPVSETKKPAVISDEEAKERLIEGLDSYIWEKIEVAERAVCDTLKDKIKDGDVILTYGCSYLLQQILTGAKKSGTKFKVMVVDGRPWREGREMLRCLVAIGIPCSYVLLSAASSVMRQVNKVLLGAHALLSNGYVMSRVGVSQVALLASAHNVPVLVACETHKFCERVQSDSFVYNEMGEPDGLAQLLGGEDGPLSDWRSIPSLSLLNLSYDVTPPELVTAVATELAVLPCTSVPVVLRIRPAEPITSRH